MRNVINYPKELNTTSWATNVNLKAYYRFVSGSELLDTTANDHDLTAIGVPVQGTPKFGGAVGLGTSQAFSAVDGADFQPAGNFSVSAWIRSTYSDGTIFASFSINTNRAGIRLRTANGQLIMESGKNTGTTLHTDYEEITSTTNTMGNGAWHHVVGTYDGAKIHLYIDGAEEGTGTAWTNAAAFAATNYVRVGCRSATGANGVYWMGSLSEVLFFNGTALSLAQVQSLYAASINDASNSAIKADANLKAIYLFADGAQLTDSTANAHTLTAIGTPTTLTTKFGGSIFLGNSSAYSAVDHADFQPTGNFTVGAWVKIPAATGDVFSSYSANTNRAGIRFGISGGGIFGSSGKNTGTTLGVDYQNISSSGLTITDNLWHFIVFTWDGSYMRLYSDGISVATPVAWANAPAYAATNYVRVGGYSTTSTALANSFAGQLDDVFLLNGTALTDAQIALLYNGRNSITQARTVLTYPRTPIGGVYIPGAKSIEGATGDTARTTDGWIEDAKYGWYAANGATATSYEFDTAVTRTGAKTLKLSNTDITGKSNVFGYGYGSSSGINSKRFVYLKPSTAYTLKYWIKTTNTLGAYIQIRQYNSAGTSTSNVNPSAMTGTNNWTLVTFNWTSDATTASADFRIRNDSAGNISDVWFDVNSMTLTEVLPRNPVV